MAQTPLQQTVAALRRRYGKPAPHPAGTDPFAHVLWESAGYLGTEEMRLGAFAALQGKTSLAAGTLAKTPLGTLVTICELGGAFAELRAKRMKESAAIVIDDFDGDLGAVLTLDLKSARRALKKFPMIGESGADRILMFCGFSAVLGLDSNGLRVLNRIGYGTETSNYSRTHRETAVLAAAELPARSIALAESSLLLTSHGRELCRRTEPRCDECPVSAHCSWFRAALERAR